MSWVSVTLASMSSVPAAFLRTYAFAHAYIYVHTHTNAHIRVLSPFLPSGKAEWLGARGRDRIAQRPGQVALSISTPGQRLS